MEIMNERRQVNSMTEKHERTSRQRVSSGSPYETQIGFCRAIRVGDMIYVAGTAPIAPDGTTASPGDAHGQAMRCLEIIQEALEGLGGRLDDVVRTRMMITHAGLWEEVGRAHGVFFASIRPAATMVVVEGLVRDDWLVEIEADAVVGP
jgi:enamine deaminase RidA (YjgF/YER057c/UK114 family)